MGRHFALTLGLSKQQRTRNSYTYMSFFKQRGKVSGCKKRIEKKSKEMGFLRFNVGTVLVALIFLFGVLYVLQVNSLSTRGYEVKNLEQRMAELKEQNKRLEIEAASLRSIQNIEDDLQALNLVPSTHIEYIFERDYALNQ